MKIYKFEPERPRRGTNLGTGYLNSMATISGMPELRKGAFCKICMDLIKFRPDQGPFNIIGSQVFRWGQKALLEI